MTAEEGSRRPQNHEKEEKDEEETSRDERGGKSLVEEDKDVVGKNGESSDFHAMTGE